MDDDIRYYGLTFPELLALAVLFQGVKVIRAALLEDKSNEIVSPDS